MPRWVFYLPFLLFIPLGAYLFFVFRRMLSAVGLKKNGAPAVIISLALTFFCVYQCRSVFGLGIVFVAYFIGFSLLVELVNFILKRALRGEGAKKRWDAVYRSGVIAVCMTLALVGYGYINMRHVVRTQYDITTEKDVGDGIRIALISDLHLGTTMEADGLAAVCARVSEENADIVCLSGDIFDEHTPLALMEEGTRMLSGIKNKYGIYYVYGNHDGNFYVDNANYALADIRENFIKNGVQVLEDSAAKCAENITVVGRLDRSLPRSSAAEVVGKADPEDFILLIDHQPNDIAAASVTGADLQLSGHTHAGQIWPTGILMELTGISGLNYGYKKIGDYQIIVTSGIGGWGYPIRTGKHSEYVVIDVHKRGTN